MTRSSPSPAKPRTAFGEPELLAAIAVLVVLLHTWLARTALNPDGVSYLDLAAAASAGDWSSFVQGYWSPLYPALIALVTMVSGRDPVAAVAAAHAINGAAMIGAVIVLWHWSRNILRPFLTRAMIAALLLVSTGLPRIEGVTPDVVLLALMVGIAHELLVHRGRRWLLTGLLLGAAFLTKTSAWPWLLLSVPLRLWSAADAMQRRGVVLSSAACAAVMLAWIVPVSVEAGRATLGSSGRLNYCWFIQACDSQSPDRHAGNHAAYRSVALESGARVEWAEFADAGRWTYAPWSDPTAWEAGVRSKASSPPTTGELVGYWARQAGRTFGIWLLPVMLAVLAPFAFSYWKARAWDRSTAVVAALGLAGVFQFIAVAAQPRLIAPFGMLAALAILHAFGKGPTPGRPLQQVATALGLLCAAAFAVPRLRDGFAASAGAERMLDQIESTRTQMRAAGLSQDRIVIVGPAIPVEASAYLSGARVVAQILPRSLDALASVPPDRQIEIIRQASGGSAQIAWVTSDDGSFRIVVLRH